MIYRYFLVFLCTASLTANANTNKQIKQCQVTVDHIQYLKNLKRHGGSGKRHNTIRKEIRKYERAYSDLRCYQVKEYLKR